MARLPALPHLVHFHIWAVLPLVPPLRAHPSTDIALCPDGIRPQVLTPPLRPYPHRGTWAPRPATSRSTTCREQLATSWDRAGYHQRVSDDGVIIPQTTGGWSAIHKIGRVWCYMHRLVHGECSGSSFSGSDFSTLQWQVVHSPCPLS